MVKTVVIKCDWLNQGMMTLIFKVWKTKETYLPLSDDFELQTRKQVKTSIAFLLAAQVHCLIRHYKVNIIGND